MKLFHGKPIFNGFAIGEAIYWQLKNEQPVKRIVEDTEAELSRLEKARALAAGQLGGMRQKAQNELGKEQAMIFDSHAMILSDPEYLQSVRAMIQAEAVNAEYAVQMASKDYADFFESMGDPFLAERGGDVEDVAKRWISCLRLLSENPSDKASSLADFVAEGNGAASEGRKVILCAEDLSPSEVLSIKQGDVAAVLLAYGSETSHASILLRSKGIPAVISLGPDFLTNLSDHAILIADAVKGEILLDPSEEDLRASVERQEELRQRDLTLETLKDQKSITLDGTKIEICANVGGAQEAAKAAGIGADGIGLFRSEFLFLAGSDYPSEEAQFQAYREALECMGDRRVIIRTLDVGADKQIDYFHLDKEANPALGMRAIRLCLTRPELFKTQLRALYRASAYGKLGIMFPMITSVAEVESILSVCGEVRAELQREGIPFDERAEIGIMIETPAAAIISDRLAPLVDFFSVGTNDLTQYALAMDRQNEKLDPFRDIHHEAVLRMIQMSAENAHANGKWIGICGELASDLTLTPYFLKIGIDELSVSVPNVLPLRERVRSIDLSNEKK